MFKVFNIFMFKVFNIFIIIKNFKENFLVRIKHQMIQKSVKLNNTPCFINNKLNNTPCLINN